MAVTGMALLFLGVGEMTTRILIGKRLLIAEVPDAGHCVFKPNQEGWYYPNLSASARMNNVGARGMDVDINLLAKEKKYIFFGDSFTFGYALQEAETIPHFFQQEGEFQKEQVLNYGNNAFGPRHMISTYHFYEKYFHPGDTVVMVLIEDDLTRTSPLYFGSRSKEILWSIKAKSSFAAWAWESSRFSVEKIRMWFSKKPTQKVSPADPYPEMGSLLTSFHAELKRKHQELVVVFYEYKPTTFSSRAREFCEAHRLHCVTDIYDTFKTLREKQVKLQIFDDLHPTPQANLAVAKGLVDHFAKKE